MSGRNPILELKGGRSSVSAEKVGLLMLMAAGLMYYLSTRTETEAETEDPDDPIVNTAEITIDSTPRGATVYIDGREVGVTAEVNATPFMAMLTAGTHTVRVAIEGYLIMAPVTVTVVKDIPQRLHFTLTIAPVDPPDKVMGFEIGEVRLSKEIIKKNESITISLEVKNTGNIAKYVSAKIIVTEGWMGNGLQSGGTLTSQTVFLSVGGMVTLSAMYTGQGTLDSFRTIERSLLAWNEGATPALVPGSQCVPPNNPKSYANVLQIISTSYRLTLNLHGTGSIGVRASGGIVSKVGNVYEFNREGWVYISFTGGTIDVTRGVVDSVDGLLLYEISGGNNVLLEMNRNRTVDIYFIVVPMSIQTEKFRMYWWPSGTIGWHLEHWYPDTSGTWNRDGVVYKRDLDTIWIDVNAYFYEPVHTQGFYGISLSRYNADGNVVAMEFWDAVNQRQGLTLYSDFIITDSLADYDITADIEHGVAVIRVTQ